MKIAKHMFKKIKEIFKLKCPNCGGKMCSILDMKIDKLVYECKKMRKEVDLMYNSLNWIQDIIEKETGVIILKIKITKDNILFKGKIEVVFNRYPKQQPCIAIREFDKLDFNVVSLLVEDVKECSRNLLERGFK